MRYAFLTIADNNGLRRVPIGFIDDTSRVISMEFGNPPNPISGPAQSTFYGKRLLLISLAILAYHFGGVWTLLGFSAGYAFLENLFVRAWSIASQTKQQSPLAAPGRSEASSTV